MSTKLHGYNRFSTILIRRELDKVKKQICMIQQRQSTQRVYNKRKKKEQILTYKSKSLVNRRLEELKQQQKDRIRTADKSR